MLSRESAAKAPKTRKRSYYGPKRKHRRSSNCRHRRITQGAVYLITKKCSRDEFLIRPSPLTNQILLYALLDRAKKYGIEIIAFCFLSNHFHLVVRDVRGRLPDFMRDFLKQTSSAIRVAEGDDRRVWSQKRYSAVKILDLDAGIRKCAYTELNPFRAGLTLPKEWPGLTTARHRAGDLLIALRPEVYFSERRPESVSLHLTSIATAFGIDSADDMEQTEEDLEALIQSEVNAIAKERSLVKQRELGQKKVLRQSRHRRGSTRVFDRNPRFASKNPALVRAAIEEDEDFEQRHQQARDRWISGKRNTVFPHGTFGFHRLYNVRVAGPRKAA